jgi:adenylate cyclase
LRRILKRESLLNTVTNTIRNALDYRQILQTIVDTVGQMLEVSCCILRPFQDNSIVDESFIYQQQRRKIGTDEGSSNIQVSESLKDTPNSSVLIQTVWETREVQVINDVTIDQRIQGNTCFSQIASAYQSANICSSLVVPLIYKQELIAVLALHQCYQPRLWQDDEVQLVVMVANEAAIALAQARAYDRISALAQREALINKITTAIRSSLDPQDIFAAITQQLGQALFVDGCAISLWTEEDEFVQCVGLYDNENPGKTPHLPQSRSPIAGNPVLQQMLKTQQPVIINDLSQQPEMKGLDLPLRSPALALLVVPLVIDGKSIGSITLRQILSRGAGKLQKLN